MTTDCSTGNAFRDLKNARVYPSIGLKRPHAQISVNFGQKPFFYNIDAMTLVCIEAESAIRNIMLKYSSWRVNGLRSRPLTLTSRIYI